MNQPDLQGNTPLFAAVAANQESSVKVRLIFHKRRESTLSIFQELLRLSANPEVPNLKRETPLHHAGQCGFTQMVELILDHLWNIQTQYNLAGDM